MEVAAGLGGVTIVAGRMTFPAAGVLPDSSTKLTVVPLTKPTPEIVTFVPPVMGPEVLWTPVTLGTIGDRTQLFTVMLVPQ
jgi:hypothetical protein